MASFDPLIDPSRSNENSPPVLSRSLAGESAIFFEIGHTSIHSWLLFLVPSSHASVWLLFFIGSPKLGRHPNTRPSPPEVWVWLNPPKNQTEKPSFTFSRYVFAWMSRLWGSGENSCRVGPAQRLPRRFCAAWSVRAYLSWLTKVGNEKKCL